MPVSTATANFLIILLNSFRDKIIYNDPKIRDSFNKLIRENNLKPVVFHSLRHSSTTYKLKLSGGDIKAVQGDTGHSEAAMITER